MRISALRLTAIPALALLAACGGDRSDDAMDAALRNDLALASSVQPGMQPYVSPQELGYANPYAAQQAYANPYAQNPYYTAAAPAPVRERVVYRSAPAQRVYSAPARPAPRPMQRNTKRDAVIGTVAGAAIGAAVTPQNRVKGAVIGGVLGGVAGAVIGNNVDVKRYP